MFCATFKRNVGIILSGHGLVGLKFNCVTFSRTCQISSRYLHETSCDLKNLYKNDKRIRLNDGNYIPTFGLGVWKIPNGLDTINAVTWALNSGYRQIDTAARYGNEESVGQALSASEIPREEIYVATKLYDDSHGYNETLEAFHKSLKRLGLDYIDLYLIHSPMNGKILPTWEAMIELKDKKLVRSIGVSNFGIHHLTELHKTFDVIPAVNQIEVHPFLQEIPLVKYCEENNIMIQAYSPLANGQKLDEKSLRMLARKYQRSPAVVLIRWCLEKGYVCIPKSSNKHRIEENITAFEFVLEKEDVDFLDSLDEGFRTCHEKIKLPWTG
ncbi:aldo keto reductase [Paramuricea clavata]|uniref:Aldo keto reductase n=1 Tax=Paramuricea clavata TaxID=317549 RepID=A0A6S7IP09_PARCT|nr:aldo keto reductase [Paramuricea clavata]